MIATALLVKLMQMPVRRPSRMHWEALTRPNGLKGLWRR